MQTTTYLFFLGNCFEAMTHYAETLGGTIESVVRNSDAPDAESRMPGGDELIMHMRVRLGDAVVVASDSPTEFYEEPRGFRVQVEPSSVEEFERIHSALSKDAKATQMPPGETFWAERFAMFTDRFGTPWMLNFEGTKAAP